MNKIYIILIVLFLMTSCERYVVEKSDITLSGKYVISKLDITNTDQNTTKDSLYTIGSTYINKYLPDPFDSIVINRFYWYMDYSRILLNDTGVNSGRDMWEYGLSPNEIFYNILSNNSYSNGYLQFDYISADSSARRMIFLIEDDGFESLQLKSAGDWCKGSLGSKQVMTLYLTRVGP